jgi:hypothetical protein
MVKYVMSVPETPSLPSSIPPTRFKTGDALKLQSELVCHIWSNLNNIEREVYEKIIDDPNNLTVLNIITVAASVGMKLEHENVQAQMRIIAEKSNNIVKLHHTVIRIMSVLILGLSAVNLFLLGALILF